MARIPGPHSPPPALPSAAVSKAREGLSRLERAEALLKARLAAHRYVEGARGLLFDPERGFLSKSGEEGASGFERWEEEEAKLSRLARADLSPREEELFEALTGGERFQNRALAARWAASMKSALHLELIRAQLERLGRRCWSAGRDASSRAALVEALEEEAARLAAESAEVAGVATAHIPALTSLCLAEAARGAAREGIPLDPVGVVAFLHEAAPKFGAGLQEPLEPGLRPALVAALADRLASEALAGGDFALARERVREAGMGGEVTSAALAHIEREAAGASGGAAVIGDFAPELREEFALLLGRRRGEPPGRERVSRALMAYELNRRELIDDEAARAALEP